MQTCNPEIEEGGGSGGMERESESERERELCASDKGATICKHNQAYMVHVLTRGKVTSTNIGS
jgi:hypothetical protein